MRRAVLLSALVAASGCASMRQKAGRWDSLTAEEHLALGAGYESRGELEAARRQYEDALSHEPNSAPALVSLGNLAFAAGELRRAEAFYRKALRADPTNGRALNNLAMTELKAGRLDAAEDLARRAEADPDARAYAADTLAKVREARQSARFTP